LNPSEDEHFTLRTSGSHRPLSRRDEERALEELLVCAEAFESAAGTPNDQEKWERTQSESLVSWAEERDYLLDPKAFEARVADLRVLEGGYEHRVFAWEEAGRVIKVTRPPHFGLYWDLKIYVRNVIRCNAVFGDDMRVEGILETPDGAALVMSQELVVGKMPSEAQVRQWFTKQGCNNLGGSQWKYPDGRIVNDAHARNFVLTHTGELYPIDLHVESMGTFQPSENS